MVSVGTVVSVPTPAYSNPPIEPQLYKPRSYFISTISLGQTTTVTSTTAHDYVIGQQVRLLIPSSNGCIQLNNQVGYVLSIPSTTQVEVSIYSLGGTPFAASSAATQPQILAIGDINSGQINSSGRIRNGTSVPGSFINIS